MALDEVGIFRCELHHVSRCLDAYGGMRLKRQAASLFRMKRFLLRFKLTNQFPDTVHGLLV
jgi:hypothetical protein